MTDAIIPKEKQADPNAARNVTMKQFHKFFSVLEEKNGEFECPVCKKSLWVLPSDAKSADHPALITLPMPFHKGVGMWAYPAYCSNCGYMIMFNAPHVVASTLAEEQE